MRINSEIINQLVLNHVNVENRLITPSAKVLRGKIQDALLAGQDAEAILLTTQLKDLQQNIVWAINNGNADTPPVIIRDARGVNRSEPCDYMAYACQGFQGIRACRTLLEVNNKLTPEITLRLNKLASQFWQTIDKTKSKQDLALLNKSLLRILQAELKISRKQATKRLSKAKDFANLETPSHAVVTLNQISYKGTIHQFFEADLPKTELTAEQIQEYQERKDKAWFKSLPLWKQELVNHHWVNHISKGNRVIPNPLRDCMVGCRNAYDKIRGHIRQNNNNENTIDIISDNLHSGTIAHLNEDIKKLGFFSQLFNKLLNKKVNTRADENLRISNLNARQMEAHAGNNAVHLITLNSEYNVNGDHQIVTHSRSAVQTNPRSRYTNLAMNVLRKITPNYYHGAKKEIRRVYNFISLRYPRNLLTEYLHGKGLAPSSREHLEKILALIKKPSYPEYLHKLLKAAVMAQFLIKHNELPKDPNNRNLSIITYLTIINFEIRKHLNKEHPRIVYACRSGKDRTGVIEFNNTKENMFYALTDTFFSLVPDDDGEKNQARLDLLEQCARSGHQRFMPGFVHGGGSTGCDGIKDDSKSSFPKSYPEKVVNLLIQPTAKLNKKILTKTPVHFLGENKDLGSDEDAVLCATRALEYYREQEPSETRRAVFDDTLIKLGQVSTKNDLLQAFKEAKATNKKTKSTGIRRFIPGEENSHRFFKTMVKNLKNATAVSAKEPAAGDKETRTPNGVETPNPLNFVPDRFKQTSH
jgi:hypothetical protein